MADPSFTAGLRPIPSGSPERPARWKAADLIGCTPTGEPVAIELDRREGRLLLAFLTIDCDGCEEFWARIRQAGDLDLPEDVSLVAITKGPRSIPSAEVAAASDGVARGALVMSDQAWTDYRVLGYPFFVLVDTVTRSVVGETVGLGWDDVIAMADARS